MDVSSFRTVSFPGFRDGLAGCCSAFFNTLQQWRATTVLALGESFGDVSDTGKAAQVIQRLSRLNPALRVVSQCTPAQDLLVAGQLAARHGRRSFDAVLVFAGPAQLQSLESEEDFADAADKAMAAIARSSRCAFLVAALEVPNVSGLAQSAVFLGRRRWLERTLKELCARHGVGWVPLLEEEGCVPSCKRELSSRNFSVDGFRPVQDPHEMWTARMLEQPALAQLVFH